MAECIAKDSAAAPAVAEQCQVNEAAAAAAAGELGNAMPDLEAQEGEDLMQNNENKNKNYEQATVPENAETV